MGNKRSGESPCPTTCVCGIVSKPALEKSPDTYETSSHFPRTSPEVTGKHSGLTENIIELTEKVPEVNEKSVEITEKSADSDSDVPGTTDASPPIAVKAPTLLAQALIILTTGLALLLVGLDSTITSTVVPTITDHFQYSGDIGWYTSAYLLATSASQLYYGRLYTMFSAKWVLLISLVIFEVGAVVGGAAPISSVLVIGRAISGLGRAGICSGVMTVLKEALPLEKRPIAGMTVGAIETVAVVTAPVFGGVLADKASWRWCFLINVPAGAIVFLILFWQLPSHPPNTQPRQRSVLRTLWSDFDNIGALLIAGSAICMVLFLTWGGFEYAWSDIRIIALIAASGASLIAFIIWEHFQGDRAILPLRYYKSRTVAMGSLFSFGIDGALNLVDSYLAIWFQLILDATPIQSGVMLLPMIISMLLGVAFSGIGTTYVGYYVPFMLLSSVCVPIATGLLTTFTPSSSKAMWIGYQALFGFGMGSGLQQPLMAAQTLENKKGGHGVEIGTAVILFTQTLGGTLTAAIAQNILLNHMVTHIPQLVPRITEETVKHTGLSDLVRQLSPEELRTLHPPINDAITATFKVALICACLSVPASLYMKWKPIKPEKETETSKSLESGSSSELQSETNSQTRAGN